MLFLQYGELDAINGAFVLIQDAIKWQIAKLKTQGRIRRIVPDKGGHSEVTTEKYKKSSESGCPGLKDEMDENCEYDGERENGNGAGIDV